jgi:hypothetical protein
MQVMAQEQPSPSNINECISNSSNIIIGDCTKEGYTEEALNKISILADKNPNDYYKALIVFNEFITTKEVETIINSSINSERIWLANPNHIGVATSAVRNNDFIGAVNTFYKSFNEYVSKRLVHDNVSEALMTNKKAVEQGDFKIYAVLVEGKANDLKSLATHTSIRIVDLHSNQDCAVEETKDNIAVNYINIPTRPDGIK